MASWGAGTCTLERAQGVAVGMKADLGLVCGSLVGMQVVLLAVRWVLPWWVWDWAQKWALKTNKSGPKWTLSPVRRIKMIQ